MATRTKISLPPPAPGWRTVLPALLLSLAVGALGLPQLAAASDNFQLNTPPTIPMFAYQPEPVQEGCWYDTTGIFFAPGPEYSSGVSEITGDANPFRCESARVGQRGRTA
jgi:hypothetical protein